MNFKYSLKNSRYSIILHLNSWKTSTLKIWIPFKECYCFWLMYTNSRLLILNLEINFYKMKQIFLNFWNSWKMKVIFNFVNKTRKFWNKILIFPLSKIKKIELIILYFFWKIRLVFSLNCRDTLTQEYWKIYWNLPKGAKKN